MAKLSIIVVLLSVLPLLGNLEGLRATARAEHRKTFLGTAKASEVFRACELIAPTGNLSAVTTGTFLPLKSGPHYDNKITVNFEINSISGCEVEKNDVSGTVALLADSHGRNFTIECDKITEERENLSPGTCAVYENTFCVGVCYMDGGDGNCFSGDSMIKLANGHLKPLSQLNVGEKVFVLGTDGRMRYEDIYILHKNTKAISPFLKISMRPKSPSQVLMTSEMKDTILSLEMTPLHFAPVSNDKGYKRAKDIKVGDEMWATSDYGTLSPYIVTEISMVKKKGAYAPFTTSGTIVVGGVVASAHSDWFLDPLLDILGLTHLLPSAYQMVLLPVRMLYVILGKSTYITFYTWLESQFDIVQTAIDYSGPAITIAIALIVSLSFILHPKTKIST